MIKMFNRKFFIIASLFLCVVGFWLISSATVAECAEKYALRIAHVVSTSDPMHEGALWLKKQVEELTNGGLQITVYPDGQLGGTDDQLEQARVGANVASIADAARLAEIVRSIGVLDMPYMTNSYEEARKVVMSDFFKEWTKQLEEYGYKVLAFNWYQGARHVATRNVPVKTPADLKGLKIRTTGSRVWQATVRAMGASPVSLEWAEVYPGLQQGVIDGCEAQYPAIYGARLYEVVKYISETGHFHLLSPLVVGINWFNSLPQDYQNILMEVAAEAGDYASQLTLKRIDDYKSEMVNSGVTILEVDTTPFREATAPLYEELGYTEERNIINDFLNQ
jgi:tripartite ATP-independent transporter DctP family solute receptor